MSEEYNNEELEAIQPIEEATTEETAVVEDAPVEKKSSSKKKSTKKTAIAKAPGMYHEGRLITAVPTRLGRKWTVIIDGKREKVLKADIEIVE